jgi:hypothetical protein
LVLEWTPEAARQAVVLEQLSAWVEAREKSRWAEEPGKSVWEVDQSELEEAFESGWASAGSNRWHSPSFPRHPGIHVDL